MENTLQINRKYLIKFLLTSAFGIFMFLIPVSVQDSSNTVVGMLSDWLKRIGAPVFPALITGLLTFSTVMSALDHCLDAFHAYPALHRRFTVKTYELVTKAAGSVIAWMTLLGMGPQMILSENTGVMMMGLGATLVAIAISLSYILPFLTNTGIMEFIGVLTQPVVRPLFKVPGCASLDLITSWFGASSAAVIMTRKKYQIGYYTKKEAAIIMTNFSLVSVPFCMVIAGMLGIEPYFPVFYLTICVLGVILAIILPRIYPISRIPQDYYEDSPKLVDARVPAGTGKFRWALIQGCKASQEFEGRRIITMGTDVMLGILLNLLPIVIAWGTAALVIVEYTPLFRWVSWPVGWCLNMVGVEEAFAAAPATLAGIVDMFIPALLAASIESVKTRFVIGVLSLIQIIYLTEVGAVIMQSKIDVSMFRLVVIFLERTVISLPLIVLVSHLIF